MHLKNNIVINFPCKASHLSPPTSMQCEQASLRYLYTRWMNTMVLFLNFTYLRGAKVSCCEFM